MTNRAIFVVGLVFVFAILTNLIINRIDKSSVPSEQAKNDPDLYMLNATVTQFGEDGSVHHKIVAQRFTHFPLTDVTALIQPKMKIFPAAPSSPWDIKSENGRLLSQSTYRAEVIELWDNVIATQLKEQGEFLNIQSQSLTVYPNKEYAETLEKVYVDDNSGRTTAAAMNAWLATGKFEFFSSSRQRVQSIFLPKFKSSAEQ